MLVVALWLGSGPVDEEAELFGTLSTEQAELYRQVCEFMPEFTGGCVQDPSEFLLKLLAVGDDEVSSIWSSGTPVYHVCAWLL